MARPSLEWIYGESRACVEELRRIGLAADAEELDRGLYGATSGEAPSLLGAALSASLRRSEVAEPLRGRLSVLLREIDPVLHSA